MTQARCRRAMTPAPASVPATRRGCSAMAAELLAARRCRLERARPDRRGAGPGHLHGPARRDRHGAGACAVAGGRAGRRVQPARARRGRGCTSGGRRGRPGGHRRAPRRGVRGAPTTPRIGDRARRARAAPRALAPEDLASVVDAGRAARRRATGGLARGRRRGDTLSRSSGVGRRGGPRGFLAAASGGRAGDMRPRGARRGGGAATRRSCRTTGAGRMRRSLWRALRRGGLGEP